MSEHAMLIQDQITNCSIRIVSGTFVSLSFMGLSYIDALYPVIRVATFGIGVALSATVITMYLDKLRLEQELSILKRM